MNLGGADTVLGVSLKLYLDPDQTFRWAERIAEVVRAHPVAADSTARLFVLPSLPTLAGVRQLLEGCPIELGAQDLFWEDRGPYTGGVSGADLRALGCTLVEVGHAERRRWFGEDDVIVNKKVRAAFRNGLTPVLCVGERVRRDLDGAQQECAAQLRSALAGVDPVHRPTSLVVAYEPEWAIGSDNSAGPEQINAMAAHLHRVLAGFDWLDAHRVIYGGSAQPGLLPHLSEDVDGLFLGRFAHDPMAFAQILDEVLELT